VVATLQVLIFACWVFSCLLSVLGQVWVQLTGISEQNVHFLVIAALSADAAHAPARRAAVCMAGVVEIFM
jgi:hypothetical protein